MTALEWNILKSALDQLDQARNQLSEEKTAQALVNLAATCGKLLKRPATREDLAREEAAR